MYLEIVDAFAERAFEGNPAAVCFVPPDSPRCDDANWMQNVAAEMNLSETAFVTPREETNHFLLRWFTPQSEVDLCGHATLAVAHSLWGSKYFDCGATLCFHTRSGVLTAQREDDNIALDFPATPAHQASLPDELCQALGLDRTHICWAGKTVFDWLLSVQNEEIVQQMQPDFARLKYFQTRGVIVTSGSEEYDFVSRFFAPQIGVNEDPVTGSAHCALAPFWSRRLNKTKMTARQLSRRGGTVRVRLENERVKLSGRAVTVLRGELQD